jgi:hypothetical protein
VTRDERRLSAVPRGLWLLLAAMLACQIAWQGTRPPRSASAADLPPPPRPEALRLASLGEPEAAARLAMLYLQAFDLGSTNSLPYQNLDYTRLIGWLRAILQLDPRSQYPLFAAARIYAEVPDPVRSRMALEFVYEEFLKDPNRRWPWLAHAALVAKHRLGDLALARRYAAALDQLATASDVPLWAKQMQVFILEDMNELEAAKIMLGGLLESGTIRDPAEFRFLRRRLEELEARLAGSQAKKRQ